MKPDSRLQIADCRLQSLHARSPRSSLPVWERIPIRDSRGKDSSSTGLLLILLLGLAIAARLPAAELTVNKSAGRIDIKLRYTTEQDYLLTGTEPVEFAVTGPCWIRVYTRLGWSDDFGASARYELVVNGAGRERRETLAAEKSTGAFGPSHERYARWRSFYVRIPTGEQTYRLQLGNSQGSSVAVRFAFEAPRPYKELVPEDSLPAVRVEDDSVQAAWYQVKSGQAVTLRITGPARLRIDGRLLYPAGTLGSADLQITANEGGIVAASQKFNVLRLKKAKLQTAKGGAPSVVRHLRLRLPAGEHELVVKLTSSKLAAGAIRFFEQSSGTQ